jgi:hypothetical protein
MSEAITDSGASVKRRVGRPLKFETVEDLQSAIEDYFANTKQEDWLITGLAVHLNTSRETLMDYEGRKEFSDAVKGAKDRIEMAYERDLRTRGTAGSIFGLKNFGWVDRIETANRNTNLDIPAGELPADTKQELVDGYIAELKRSTTQD